MKAMDGGLTPATETEKVQDRTATQPTSKKKLKPTISCRRLSIVGCCVFIVGHCCCYQPYVFTFCCGLLLLLILLLLLLLLLFVSAAMHLAIFVCLMVAVVGL